MNNKDEKPEEKPLITEPDEKIGILETLETPVMPIETPVEGLPLLVKKVYPYTLGLIVSVINYLPTILWKVWDYSVLRIHDSFEAAQRKADEEKLYYLKDIFGYSDEVLEQQARAQRINPMLGFVIYLFDVAYSCIIGVVSEIQIKRAIILRRRNIDLPSQVPAPEITISAYLKTHGEAAKYEKFLAELGLGEEERQTYLEAMKQIPSLDILLQNLWRGKITPVEFNTYLAKLAFDKDEQTIITNIVDRIPPIQDIIRFAVREAFSEELSAKYEHDVEFPKEVAEWSAKQGFPEHWARKYWRAHWELPSVQMVFEMLHRKVRKPDGTKFNVNDINDLLRMADYPRFWRGLLTQISYRVITRVDARRMYDLGIWDNLPDMTAEEKVKDVYMQMGYNEEDATYMTDFTVHYTEEKRRSYTTTGLKKLRKYGIITEATFREKLKSIRVREDEIDYIIDETNYELEDKRLDSFMNKAKAMYLNDRWDKSQVQIEMSKVGIHVSEPNNLFESWDYDKQSTRRVLTKTDIIRLLTKGVIKKRKDAYNKLLEYGYDELSANWLIDEAIADVQAQEQTTIEE